MLGMPALFAGAVAESAGRNVELGPQGLPRNCEVLTYPTEHGHEQGSSNVEDAAISHAERLLGNSKVV